MVSKRNILGKPSIVFVTIGSTNFQFDRLFSAIDQSMLQLSVTPLLVVQAGVSTYTWSYKHIQQYKYISPVRIRELSKKADKIIVHGGFGTLYSVSKCGGTMPLIVPRLHAYKEHVDDHQRLFIQFLMYKFPVRYRKYLAIEENLTTVISWYLQSKFQKNICSSYLFQDTSKDMLIKNLHKYLDTI